MRIVKTRRLALPSGLAAGPERPIRHRIQKAQDVLAGLGIETVGQNSVGSSDICGQLKFRIIENDVSVITDAELGSDLHGDSHFSAILGHIKLLPRHSRNGRRWAKRSNPVPVD
jgi:hypothetical protein